MHCYLLDYLPATAGHPGDPQDRHCPGGILIHGPITDQGTLPLSLIYSPDYLRDIRQYASTYTPAALKTAYHASLHWQSRRYALRGRTVIDCTNPANASLAAFAAASPPVTSHPAQTIPPPDSSARDDVSIRLHMSCINTRRLGVHTQLPNPSVIYTPPHIPHRPPQYTFHGNNSLPPARPLVGAHTDYQGSPLFQDSDHLSYVEINSGCTRSFVTARFLHFNLLTTEVTLNPEGVCLVTDHLGRTYESKYHIPRARVTATHGTPSRLVQVFYLDKVAVLLQYSDPTVDVCLARDFTDTSHAVLDSSFRAIVHGGGNGWPATDDQWVEGGISLGQPQVPGSALTVPCTHLSVEPLPPGHVLLDAPPTAAFLEPLCHAGLANMPLALSGEALMQALHALFTHKSTGVLPHPHPDLHLPWFPLSYRPHPWSSLNLWPFVIDAGRVHPTISLLGEILHFDSIGPTTRARVRNDPAISGRSTFNTAHDPVGCVVKGKTIPLRYPATPQAEAEWVDTNSNPVPPSRRLLIRVLTDRCRALQLQKLSSLYAFRRHAQSYARNVPSQPPDWLPRPDDMQEDYASAVASHTFLRVVLHQLHQNQHLDFPSAAHAAGFDYRVAIVHTFYRRTPQHFRVPASWGFYTPEGPIQHATDRAAAIICQTMAAANHLSFLIGSLNQALSPALGPVTPQSMSLAASRIHSNPHRTYELLLEPHSFPMGPFCPYPNGSGHELRYHGQHIGPIPGDDRGAYLADVRRLAHLSTLPHFTDQLPGPHE